MLGARSCEQAREHDAVRSLSGVKPAQAMCMGRLLSRQATADPVVSNFLPATSANLFDQVRIHQEVRENRRRKDGRLLSPSRLGPKQDGQANRAGQLQKHHGLDLMSEPQKPRVRTCLFLGLSIRFCGLRNQR